LIEFNPAIVYIKVLLKNCTTALSKAALSLGNTRNGEIASWSAGGRRDVVVTLSLETLKLEK
jgi:hypothetical protein